MALRVKKERLARIEAQLAGELRARQTGFHRVDDVRLYLDKPKATTLLRFLRESLRGV